MREEKKKDYIEVEAVEVVSSRFRIREKRCYFLTNLLE